MKDEIIDRIVKMARSFSEEYARLDAINFSEWAHDNGWRQTSSYFFGFHAAHD